MKEKKRLQKLTLNNSYYMYLDKEKYVGRNGSCKSLRDVETFTAVPIPMCCLNSIEIDKGRYWELRPFIFTRIEMTIAFKSIK